MLLLSPFKNLAAINTGVLQCIFYLAHADNLTADASLCTVCACTSGQETRPKPPGADDAASPESRVSAVQHPHTRAWAVEVSFDGSSTNGDG